MIHALPTKYPLRCRLIDLLTQKEVAQFSARTVRDRRVDTAFEGGNVASGGQSYSVATAELLEFAPGAQQVDVEGVIYILTAVQPVTHDQAGRTYSRRARTKEIVLELE